MKKVFFILVFFMIFFILNLQCVHALDRWYNVGTADMISPSTDIGVSVSGTFDMQCQGTSSTSSEKATLNWRGYLEYNTSVDPWDSIPISGGTDLEANGSNPDTVVAPMAESTPLNFPPHLVTAYDIDIYWVRCRVYDEFNFDNATSVERKVTVSGPTDNFPIVTLNYPDDYANFSSTIPFNCTASDDINLVNVSLYGNWTGWHLNDTNTPANSTPTIFSKTISGDGTYVWNCQACDNATTTQCNFSVSNRTFTVDSTAPTITLPVYTNATPKQNTEDLTLNINVDDGSGVGIDSCIVNVATGAGNQTITYSNGWCNDTYSLTGTNEGNQTINVYANDTLGNTGLNNSYVVWIDNTAPTITLPVYTNATKKKNSEDLTLNINVDDGSGVGIDSCIVNVATGAGNQTITYSNGWCNDTYSLTGATDGNQTINVYANDTAGNYGLNDDYVVWIDNTAPTITLPVYANATKKKSSEDLTLNINVDDGSGVGIDSCIVNVATGAGNQTITYSNGWCNDTYSLTGATDGNQTINVYANDTLGNTGLNNSYVVWVDDTAPMITVASPLSQNYTTTIIDFNVSLNENTDWCGFSLDENANVTMTKFNNTYFNYTNSSMTQGEHNITFSCNDTLGNMNASAGLTYFTVDSQGPIINTEGANETNISQNEWFCLNITATDSVNQVDTVYAEVWDTSSWSNYTMTDTGSTSCDGISGDYIYGVEIQGTPQGIWNYSKAHANDTLNNWDSHDFSDLTINVTAPADANYPQFSDYWDDNATIEGSGTGNFNVTVTSTNGTVWLEINNTNVTATNLTADVYNASHYFSTNGTYAYRWHSWGNGTQENYNVSIDRNYTVNESPGNYYVDNLSIGGSCSDSYEGTNISEPWCTLSKAASTVIAGNTVYIRNATYLENINPANSGSAGNPITFKAYNNERVILDGSAEITGWIQDSGNRYRANVTFTPDAPFGIAGYGCDDDNEGGLVLQDGAKFNYCMAENISDVDSEGEYYMNDSAGCSAGTPCTLYVYARDLGNGYNPNNYEMRVGKIKKLIDLDGGEDYITIDGLEIRRVQDNGLHSTGSVGIVVRNSKFYSSYISGLYLISTSDNALIENNTFWDAGHGAIEFSNSDNHIIRKNLFKKVDLGDGYGANGAHISYTTSPATFNNTIIENNIFWETGSDYMGGFSVRIAGDNDTVQHNTFYRNAGATAIGVVSGGDSKIRNNVIYNYDGLSVINIFATAVSDGGHVIEYNNFYAVNSTERYRWDGINYDSVADWEAASGQSNNIDGDPLLVDIYGRDFHLQTGSPAIDSGINVSVYEDFENTTRPIDGDNNGTAEFDMGGYEYNASSQYTVVTLESPSNGTSTSNTTINFNCSAVDNINLANITLYGNWSGWHANETKSLTGTSNSTTFTKTLSEGTYLWNCLAYDNDSNSDWGDDNYTLTIDNEYPQFSGFQEDPINDSDYLFGQAYQFNSTVTYTNGTVSLNFDGTNYSASNISDEFYVDIASLSAGTYNYYWWGYGNGTLNNYNSSETIVYVVQQAIGEVYAWINNQQENRTALLYNEEWLNATLNAGDSNVNCTLYYNDTLIEQGPCPLANLTNFTQLGLFNVTAFYDGNENWTNDYETWWVNVTEDSPPTVNIVYPDNITYNTNVTQLNYTVEDDISLSHCWYSLNGGETNSSPNPACSNYTDLTSIEGSNNWTVWANDSTNQIGSDIVFFTKDTVPPDVTINSPLNQTYNTNSTLFNVTATDITTSVNSCWYSLDAGVNNNSMSQSGDYWTNTNSSMTQGGHTVNYYCNDSYNNVNDTEQEIFFIDSIYPLIDYEPETPLNNSNLSQNYIYVNVTWTEDNFENITYRLYNSTSEVDVTTYTSEIYEINWTPLSNEVYTYNVTIIDIANNANTTETRTITLDTIYPQVNIIYPENDSYTVNVTDLNYTVDDDISLSHCWYSLNGGGTNSSPDPACSNHTDLTSIEGSNNWTVYANDTAGNENSTSVFFTKDTVPPDVTINSPLNQTYNTNSTLFNVTATDITTSVNSCWYSLDAGVNNNSMSQSGDYWTNTNSSMTQGGHTVNYYCNDSYNNVNDTEQEIFFIDSIYPTLNIVYPQNDSYTVNVTDLNYTYTEANPDKCWYSTNGGATNLSIQACTLNFSDVISVEGSNNWTVYINDTAGNENSTSVFFTKDTKYPQFSGFQEDPINDSDYLFGQAYQFNSTVTYTNGTVSLNFDGTNYSASNISDEFYVDIASLSAGTYNYYWWGYGNGTLNHYNSSDTRVYVVQKINPDASLENTDAWTVTYPEEVTINYSESNDGDTDVVYKVYRDNVDKGSEETVTLGYGDYNYVLNTTGGTNYTANSSLDAETLTVQQNTGSCSVVFNASSGITYGAIFRVWTNCTTGFVLYRNETPIENNSPQNLAADTYNFTVIRNDTVNYSNIYDEETFVVQQATPILTKKLNTVDDNISINYPTQVNASASTTGGTVNIYRNETDVTSQNNQDVSLAVGYYKYEFNITGNENYTDVSSVFLYATINKGTSEVATYIYNTRNNKSVLLNSEKWLNATLETGVGDIKLYYNDTLINQGSSPLSNFTNFTQEGEFNVSGIYAGNENYTSDIETWWVTVSTDSAPTVNIIYPENISYDSDITQLNYTVDDDISVSHCWYSLDGGETTSIPDETCSNFTSLASIEGSNNWTVYANDSTNQIGSDIVFFTKDTTYPSVTINSPLNQTYNTDFILFNITATDTTTSVNSCWYSLTAGSYNYSMSQSGDFWTHTNSSMNQGSHTVNYYCNDSAGNLNDTEQETFFIDSIYPLIDYEPETPLNNSNLSQNYIYVNVTWTEDNFENITYRLYNSTSEVDVTTYTSEIYEINWTNLPNETYKFNATMFDIAGNSNSTLTRTVNLDTIYPIFSNHQRNPDPPHEDQNVQVNVTITDNNRDTVILEWNGTTNYTVITSNGDEYYFTIINGSGNYTAHDSVTYYWYANDTATNMNKSAQQFFIVANQIPTLSPVPSLNETSPKTNDILNCTDGNFSDDDAEDNPQNTGWRWYKNDIEISGEILQTLDLSTAGNGNKGDVIKCSERVHDNYNWSNWYNSSNTATIDNTAPTIDNPQTTVNKDADGTPYNYDYEATDPDVTDGVDTLTWYDNTTLLFDINPSTGVISDIPTEDEAGSYEIRISASDGTINATDDFTYIINDTTSPNIDFQPPTEENEAQLTRNYIQVNVTASDGKAIDTITIRLYNSTSWVQTNTSLTSPLFVNFTNLPDENYYFNATVNDTYGNTNQTETFTVSTDTGPPTINYVSPTENPGAYKSQNYVEVNVTAEDDPNLDKIVIRLYNSSHTQIDSAITSSSPNFANFTGLSNGLYYYNATANDTFGNDNSSSTRNITLDTIVPLIDFTTGTEDNGTTHSRDWIFVNVTVTEDNEDTITFSLYNQTTLVDETPYTNQQRTINWTDLPNEIYYYNVTVNDTAGNSNNTETNKIILDTEGPQVSLLTESPDDPADYSEGGIYMFNATVTDPSLDVVWVDFNGTNYTATPLGSNIYNITLTNLGIGTYDYRWYANDSFGNLNDSENGTYTIGQGTPNLGLTITPSNNVDYPTETTANGTGCPTQLTCNLYRNDTGEITPPDVATLGVGVYNYTYNTTGNANYTSASVSDILTISQATGIVFTYLNNSQSNITIEQYTEIYLNSTLETGQAGENITLYYNDTLIEQGPSPLYNLTNFTTIGLFNITTIYDGNENYSSASETWWVNVTEFDVTPPQISITYPQNNTNYSSVQTELNYTAWDNFGLNECWYSINGGAVNETITCGQNVTGLNSGQESSTWIVYANDAKGNENFSSVTFFVDSINPTINFVTPTETNQTILGRNYIQVNTTANDTNLDKIVIRLYNSTSLVETNTSATNVFFVNYTGLSAETYYFNATANDTLGNNISTETRTIFLVLPNLTIIKPENETYITTKNLLLDYIVSYEDYVLYNIDNTENTTISGNTTFNVSSEENHTLYLYANNTLGTISKNVTFFVNTTKFIVRYDNYAGTEKGNSTDFNASSFEDLQNLSTVILENTDYGKISFNETINMTDDANISDNEIDLDTYTNISSNHIEINSTALPNLNKSATLNLYNLSYANPRILRDNSVCSSDICTKESYSPSTGNLQFRVTQFTIYSAEETPVEEAPSEPGVGEGAGVECFNNSDCEGDEICWNYVCVKLFDVKIIDFESPAKLGDFFDFTYFIKGMANINDDVEVRFWIEKDGGKIASGSDVIYLGSFEEKTETTKIFLPSNLKSGIYDFYVEVVHKDYTAKSHRTIEIQVREGIAIISPIDIKGIGIFVLIFALFLFALILFIIFYAERKKIKKFLLKDEKWMKKHKLSVIALLLIIILVILLYFSNLFDPIINLALRVSLWFKLQILPNLIYITQIILVIVLIIIFFIIAHKKKWLEKLEIKIKKRKKKKLIKKKYKAKVRKTRVQIKRFQKEPKEFFGKIKKNIKSMLDFLDEKISFRIKRTREQKRIRNTKRESIRKKRRLEKTERRLKKNREKKRKEKKQRKLEIKQGRRKRILEIRKEKIRKEKRSRRKRRKSLLRKRWEKIKEIISKKTRARKERERKLEIKKEKVSQKKRRKPLIIRKWEKIKENISKKRKARKEKKTKLRIREEKLGKEIREKEKKSWIKKKWEKIKEIISDKRRARKEKKRKGLQIRKERLRKEKTRKFLIKTKWEKIKEKWLEKRRARKEKKRKLQIREEKLGKEIREKKKFWIKKKWKKIKEKWLEKRRARKERRKTLELRKEKLKKQGVIQEKRTKSLIRTKWEKIKEKRIKRRKERGERRKIRRLRRKDLIKKRIPIIIKKIKSKIKALKSSFKKLPEKIPEVEQTKIDVVGFANKLRIRIKKIEKSLRDSLSEFKKIKITRPKTELPKIIPKFNLKKKWEKIKEKWLEKRRARKEKSKIRRLRRVKLGEGRESKIRRRKFLIKKKWERIKQKRLEKRRANKERRKIRRLRRKDLIKKRIPIIIKKIKSKIKALKSSFKKLPEKIPEVEQTKIDVVGFANKLRIRIKRIEKSLRDSLSEFKKISIIGEETKRKLQIRKEKIKQGKIKKQRRIKSLIKTKWEKIKEKRLEKRRANKERRKRLQIRKEKLRKERVSKGKRRKFLIKKKWEKIKEKRLEKRRVNKERRKIRRLKRKDLIKKIKKSFRDLLSELKKIRITRPKVELPKIVLPKFDFEKTRKDSEKEFETIQKQVYRKAGEIRNYVEKRPDLPNLEQILQKISTIVRKIKNRLVDAFFRLPNKLQRPIKDLFRIKLKTKEKEQQKIIKEFFNKKVERKKIKRERPLQILNKIKAGFLQVIYKIKLFFVTILRAIIKAPGKIKKFEKREEQEISKEFRKIKKIKLKFPRISPKSQQPGSQITFPKKPKPIIPEQPRQEIMPKPAVIQPQAQEKPQPKKPEQPPQEKPKETPWAEDIIEDIVKKERENKNNKI